MSSFFFFFSLLVFICKDVFMNVFFTCTFYRVVPACYAISTCEVGAHPRAWPPSPQWTCKAPITLWSARAFFSVCRLASADHFPPHPPPPVTTLWAQLINPRATNQNRFICPSEPRYFPRIVAARGAESYTASVPDILRFPPDFSLGFTQLPAPLMRFFTSVFLALKTDSSGVGAIFLLLCGVALFF